MNENEIVESLKAHIDSRLSEMALGIVQGSEPMTVAIVGLRKDLDDLRSAMADMQSAFEMFCRRISENVDGDEPDWLGDPESWKND